MAKRNNLTKASYLEWQASLFGASIISLGLGVEFASFLKPMAAILIILGVLLHGWGMYKMHQRNKN